MTKQDSEAHSARVHRNQGWIETTSASELTKAPKTTPQGSLVKYLERREKRKSDSGEKAVASSSQQEMKKQLHLTQAPEDESRSSPHLFQLCGTQTSGNDSQVVIARTPSEHTSMQQRKSKHRHCSRMTLENSMQSGRF